MHGHPSGCIPLQFTRLRDLNRDRHAGQDRQMVARQGLSSGEIAPIYARLQRTSVNAALGLLVGKVRSLSATAGRRGSAAAIREWRVEAVGVRDRPGHVVVGVVEPLELATTAGAPGAMHERVAADRHVAALALDRLDLGADNARNREAAPLLPVAS